MLEAKNLTASMSSSGNCHDNACAERFFQLLKWKRIRRKIYRTREEGKQNLFNYIELFYNSTKRDGNNNDLTPRGYEQNYFLKQRSV